MTENSDASASRILEELINAIRSKECILLAGPGLSHYARTALGGSPPRRWKDTLEKLISSCWEENIIDQTQKTDLDTLMSSASLLEAGGKLQDYLKANDESQSLLQKPLRDILLCNQAKAGNVHLLLAQIPFCGYCTINYDTFIEDAYLRVYELHPATFDLTLIDNARQEYLAARNSKQAEQKFILKLLGDVYHPASLNLGDRYLEKYLKENSKCREALAKIFARPSILLIGFEPDDPDLKGLTANETIFKSTPKPNQYTILVEGKSQQSLGDKKITPIWYESETELVSILEEIMDSLRMQPVIEKRVKSGILQPLPQTLNNTSFPTSPKTGHVHIFISWAQGDEVSKQELLKYLDPLVQTGVLSILTGKLGLGIDIPRQIEEHLKKADIFLPLISSDFLADDHCKKELEKAKEKYNAYAIRIIPVLIRSCVWAVSFNDLDLPVLPDDKNPIMDWDKQDQAYTNVVEGIQRVAEELNQESDRQQKSG